ncbi:hypothetical protein NA57DRAFT_74437 [Rhizodiscina lignyota]|uniref:BTB domain-containing protein n=1 Tax=Rhizodiscina lignyota TaxID=1504668 RepID=A0A9P4IKB1_9PEZI|nr:hypothetical protein NA57DRAFT_74437 [Rhizodiscina lignyota]
MVKVTPETFETPLISPIGFKIIYVRVGYAATSFSVHKSLLCLSSHEFSRVLDSDSRQHVVLEVADAEVRVFKMYMDWLYQGQLPAHRVDIPFATSWLHRLLDLYIFATGYRISQLQRAVMDQLVGSRKVPTTDSSSQPSALYQHPRQCADT